MERAAEYRSTPRAATLLLVAAVCAFVVALSVRLAESGVKTTGIVLVALTFPAAAVYYGRLRELLVAGWVIALTYNRQYFSFEAITGNNGTQGPYWIAADIFFIALLLLWAADAVRGSQLAAARSRRLWPWFAPLAVACVLSITASQRPEWSAYELIRFVKFGLVLAYIRHNFGRREWIAAVAALGLAMSFQSLVGVKEIVTGHSGVLGLGQQITGLDGYEDVFSEQSFYGWVRATGTMNHPPNLACYLILVIPVFLALGLTARSRRLRVVSLGVFLLGCVGLACTLSRWPWALAGGEILLVLATLVALRQLPLLRAAGMLLTGVLALLLALVPIRQKVMDRLTRDLTESVDQRAEGNRVALSMIAESPIVGIGLNNSKLHILRYMPDLAWAVENEDFLTHEMKSRSLAAMGNGFFFVAVETGVLGSIGFVICLIGSSVCALRAIGGTRGAVRGASLGISLGLLAMLLQQLVDFSLWVDPLLYSAALCIGLLHVAPVLFPAEEQEKVKA